MLNQIIKRIFQPGFCSRDWDGREKGNKDEPLSRFFSRKQSERWQVQKIK